MLTSAVVSLFLCQAEIDEKQFITMPSNTHEEVVWFDIAMNEIFVVYVFNSPNHLIRQHQYGLHCESSRTEVK